MFTRMEIVRISCTRTRNFRPTECNCPTRVFAVRRVSRQTVKGDAHGPNSERRRRGFAYGIAAVTRRAARQTGIR